MSKGDMLCLLALQAENDLLKGFVIILRGSCGMKASVSKNSNNAWETFTDFDTIAAGVSKEKGAGVRNNLTALRVDLRDKKLRMVRTMEESCKNDFDPRYCYALN